MAINLIRPVSGDRKADWDRTAQFYGVCELEAAGSGSPQVAKGFRDWAATRHLALVEGEHLVAFDPKAMNPKDSLDRAKFGFLLRYMRPRDSATFRRDLQQAFNVQSIPVLDAIKGYWAKEGVVHEASGYVSSDQDLLRLMGFTYIDLINALDGVVKKAHLLDFAGGKQAFDPAFAEPVGNYLVNFDLMRDRFFDAAFIVHAAGQPVSLNKLGEQMGIDDMGDLRAILKEARKRFDLNIEVGPEHVMFGAPSQQSIEGLVNREKGNRQRLEQTERQLRDHQGRVKEMLDRYNAREARILNENETLREEGRLVWIKAKMVRAALDQTTDKRK